MLQSLKAWLQVSALSLPRLGDLGRVLCPLVSWTKYSYLGGVVKGRGDSINCKGEHHTNEDILCIIQHSEHSLRAGGHLPRLPVDSSPQ